MNLRNSLKARTFAYSILICMAVTLLISTQAMAEYTPGLANGKADQPAQKADVIFNTLTQSLNPTNPGQPFTVSYSFSGQAPDSGTVTISDTVNTCTVPVAQGSCTLALTTPGARSITARYNGNTTYNPATSAPLIHTIRHQSRTTLSTNKMAYALGEIVTVGVSVVSADNPGSDPTPSGTVMVNVDNGDSARST